MWLVVIYSGVDYLPVSVHSVTQPEIHTFTWQTLKQTNKKSSQFYSLAPAAILITTPMTNSYVAFQKNV